MLLSSTSCLKLHRATTFQDESHSFTKKKAKLVVWTLCNNHYIY